jgi:DNA-binding LytR/AlgR family response regulator
MKVTVKPIKNKESEQVVIECVEITREVREIEAFVSSRGDILSGYEGERLYTFPLSGVFYFEAVDERCFAYTKERVYELKIRLYVLEEAYREKFFARGSKSVLINLLKLDSISPALNGRFTALMKNGEKLIISRQYAAAFKKAILEGAKNGI